MTRDTRGLQELGIRQIFARSPQAKGRVERMAETFQDRLVTELRLAAAMTIGQATVVLRDFLPRFNARFAVQPQHPEAAYRPVSPELCVSETLCFKHTRKVARDNTVKYHWRVLQLLPGRECPSYAGLRVEVLERPDRELIVQYQGHTVSTQEPPPRIGALWAAVSPGSPGPELKRVVSSVGDHHISRSQHGVWPPSNRCISTRPRSRPLPGKTPSAKGRIRGSVRRRPPRRPAGRLSSRPKKLALAACMRKLLTILNNMMRTGVRWDTTITTSWYAILKMILTGNSGDKFSVMLLG